MVWEEFDGFYFADEQNPVFNPAADWQKPDSTDPKAREPRVLVVDDEKRIADSLCEILHSSGFHAIAAYDGWAALDAAARFNPDYLLSDVLMPSMNGVELAIAIRQTCPRAKILLFSGQAGIAQILEAGKKRGFTFDLVSKPIHPLKLVETLKQL